MKVLVSGSQGQLGRDVVTALSTHHTVFAFGRNEFDITDSSQVFGKIRELLPDVIIHCAAYTAVDLAESEVDKAYLVNAVGTRNISAAAESVGAKVCYISTDYVFDGKSTAPYKEYDETNPQSVYGRSKWAGEQLVQSLSTKYFIVRTSWVFGRHGNNFVKTMLKLAQEKNVLQVVNDQIGSPTYTVDLAAFLSALVVTEKYGIYHASNSGACSWFEFSKEIFNEVRMEIDVKPCSTEQFPRPALRPAYSVMDHMAIRINGFTDLPPWQDALRRFLKEIGEYGDV